MIEKVFLYLPGDIGVQAENGYRNHSDDIDFDDMREVYMGGRT
ncbi:hypothetical protein [Lentibacillus jeotgali]|nr:hypothetical protein [Lentibacillus jeotgali]